MKMVIFHLSNGNINLIQKVKKSHPSFSFSLDHLYGQHKAFAVFKTDSAGCIDLMTAKPLRGTYFGKIKKWIFI